MDLVDNASFKASMEPGAIATRAIRYHLAASEQSIDWTCLYPAAFTEPRPRTAKFRPGSTTLLMSGDKPAAYGVADLSAALFDELEPPCMFTNISLLVDHRLAPSWRPIYCILKKLRFRQDFLVNLMANFINTGLP
ncbi:hypothetical protein AAIO65_08655 [Erwinia amylovora]|uniref:hypothetical protein n=1 Tax=Erwinia amylovora TaxID=552 RepID=UPI0014448C0D|nr:hypothetical protein [Erwinia amylovora]